MRLIKMKAMEANFSPDIHTAAGTLGGTFFALLLEVHSGDMLKTVILTATGAGVSFAVSMLLKFVVKVLKKHWK